MQSEKSVFMGKVEFIFADDEYLFNFAEFIIKNPTYPKGSL